MPVGPEISAAYGPAIAAESQAIEREIERLARQQQARAAARDATADVDPRLRMDVQACQARLLAAEQAMDAADTQARLRIHREHPSEQLARLWHEEMTLSAARELQTARQELAAVELRLGEQVQARRALAAFDAIDAAEHAAIDEECAQRHEARRAMRRKLVAAVFD